MKIRCNNCYRVLNINEEYCTSCGEHSAQMQKAMVTGNFGPDATGKLKTSLGIYAIAGFIISGVLQVIFAILQVKDISVYNELYCGTHSLFYSSILTFILMILYSCKDLKETPFTKDLSTYFLALIIGILAIAIIILLSHIFTFTTVFPKYIIEYLRSSNDKFFNPKQASIFKIIIAYIFCGISIEVLCRKRLIDVFDESLMGDKAILLLTSLIVAVLETAWIMSLEVFIPLLFFNLILTGIYMYTDRNIFLNIILRILLVLISIIIFI